MFQDFPAGIYSQFPAGSDDRLAQNPKPSKPSQGETKINFFSDEQALVETADRVEVLAGGKKESAGAEIESKVNCAKQFERDACPQRNCPANHNARTAAGAALFECVDRCGNVLFIDASVGIDKEKNIAGCCACAGVARRGNLPAIN